MNEGCEQVPPFCPACGCGLDVINNNDEIEIYVCSFCGHAQTFDETLKHKCLCLKKRDIKSINGSTQCADCGGTFQGDTEIFG